MTPSPPFIQPPIFGAQRSRSRRFQLSDYHGKHRRWQCQCEMSRGRLFLRSFLTVMDCKCVKETLITCYVTHGSLTPVLSSFSPWLSLLPGFFRIPQLDVINEVQDRARLEILGQALKDSTQTYFRERHQKIQEQGEVWDFREAILDLRDRNLYKSTPFIAARNSRRSCRASPMCKAQ